MYVMGGETRKSGPDGQIKLSGQRTYYRVDVYDLDRNKWTQVHVTCAVPWGMTLRPRSERVRATAV